MSCILNSGIPLGCLDSTAGLKSVLIGKFNATGTTFTEDSNQVITGITSTETFYQFKFRKQTGNFTEELAVSVENGTKMNTQTLTLIFHKLETAKRNAILLLAKTDLHVIVETQNGEYWFLGKVNAMNLTTGSGASGQAFGDLNGYTLVFGGVEPDYAYEISSTAVGTLTTSA